MISDMPLAFHVFCTEASVCKGRIWVPSFLLGRILPKVLEEFFQHRGGNAWLELQSQAIGGDYDNKRRLSLPPQEIIIVARRSDILRIL